MNTVPSDPHESTAVLSAERPSESALPAAFLFDVVLVLLVFFVHAGEPVPDVNEPHYLTKARHYWDPSFAAGDFFLESADAHKVFYWSLGWLTCWFSLPVVGVGPVAWDVGGDGMRLVLLGPLNRAAIARRASRGRGIRGARSTHRSVR